MFSSALPISLLLTTVAAQTQFAGVNIAGFDFGCGTDGTDDLTSVTPPLASVKGNPDGQGQMAHFVEDDGLNLFRLPVGWQYLVNDNVGGTLDAGNFATYDILVQSCLSTGSHCIIDIHNYARWDGEIIGQGGPTNDEFASLWSQIATKYTSESNIIFGIMNEPHDIPDITLWAETVQAAVTAIRTAGAATQMILLPGNGWTSAQTFVSDGSGAALSAIKNLDGTNTSLIFDVHKYLDSDGSGTHTDCSSDHVSDTFAPLATWLREQGRQAMLTETGGGNTATCLTDVCTELAYLNANNDVYLGYTGWAAGAFALTYELVETPSGSNGSWVDQEIVTQCIVGTRTNSTSTLSTSTSASTSTSSTSASSTPTSTSSTSTSSTSASSTSTSTSSTSTSSTSTSSTSAPSTSTPSTSTSSTSASSTSTSSTSTSSTSTSSTSTSSTSSTVASSSTASTFATSATAAPSLAATTFTTSEKAALDKDASKMMGYKVPATKQGNKASSGRQGHRTARRFSQ